MKRICKDKQVLILMMSYILMEMSVLLLARLVQLSVFAITTTVYSSPQCRSSQEQWVALVWHGWAWPSSPVAVAVYVSAPSLEPQLTEPVLSSHCT